MTLGIFLFGFGFCSFTSSSFFKITSVPRGAWDQGGGKYVVVILVEVYDT